MTAPLGIRRSDSRRSRRSRSPEVRPPSSPESIRQRSETRTHTSAPLKEDISVPAYLDLTKNQILAQFHELEWQERIRLAQGHQHQDPSFPWTHEDTPLTNVRDRYTNIKPWANNRVHLQVPTAHCDYINASPITLRSLRNQKEKRYIATQGPKQGQFNHVWRMIWHETASPAVIVMLTPLREANWNKCFQYYPEDFDSSPIIINDEDEFGDGFNATVTLIENNYHAESHSHIRKLSLKVGEEEKVVWHLLFSRWPDFSIPEGEDRDALLELIKLSNVKSTGDGPRIIHCSAGVGRSGTFITLDHLLCELEDDALKESPDDTDVVFNTVNALREQRMTMVQSESQLHFIYQVLRQKWDERYRGSISSSNFRNGAPLLEENENEKAVMEVDDKGESNGAELVTNPPVPQS